MLSDFCCQISSFYTFNFACCFFFIIMANVTCYNMLLCDWVSVCSWVLCNYNKRSLVCFFIHHAILNFFLPVAKPISMNTSLLNVSCAQVQDKYPIIVTKWEINKGCWRAGKGCKSIKQRGEGLKGHLHGPEYSVSGFYYLYTWLPIDIKCMCPLHISQKSWPDEFQMILWTCLYHVWYQWLWECWQVGFLHIRMCFSAFV